MADGRLKASDLPYYDEAHDLRWPHDTPHEQEKRWRADFNAGLQPVPIRPVERLYTDPEHARHIPNLAATAAKRGTNANKEAQRFVNNALGKGLRIKDEKGAAERREERRHRRRALDPKQRLRFVDKFNEMKPFSKLVEHVPENELWAWRGAYAVLRKLCSPDARHSAWLQQTFAEIAKSEVPSHVSDCVQYWIFRSITPNPRGGGGRKSIEGVVDVLLSPKALAKIGYFVFQPPCSELLPRIYVEAESQSTSAKIIADNWWRITKPRLGDVNNAQVILRNPAPGKPVNCIPGSLAEPMIVNGEWEVGHRWCQRSCVPARTQLEWLSLFLSRELSTQDPQPQDSDHDHLPTEAANDAAAAPRKRSSAA